MKDQILCFGEVLWDNLPTGAMPGGAPMNVAIHLRRFGLNSKVASSVGNDQKGRDLTTFIAREGIDTSLVQIHENLPTSEVKVHLDESNNATFEICEPVAWDDICLTPLLENEVVRSNAIVYGSLASRNALTRDTLLALLSHDLLKIMDVNLRPPFDTREIVEPLLIKADIIKLNDHELTTIARWFDLEGDLEVLSTGLCKALPIKLLMVTKGDKGALIVFEGKVFSHNGYKVEVVDTVGAGDAFLAGFLAAYLHGTHVQASLEQACAIGAHVASRAGAVPHYDLEALKAFC